MKQRFLGVFLTIVLCAAVLSAVPANAATHQHYGIRQEGQEATQDEGGWKAYYLCSCGLYFEDVNCITLIGNEAMLEVWKGLGGNGHLQSVNEQFEEYRQGRIQICDTRALTETSAAALSCINAAKTTLKSIVYDTDKTYDENCDLLDEVIRLMNSNLEEAQNMLLDHAKLQAKEEIAARLERLKPISAKTRAIADSTLSVIDAAPNEQAVENAKTEGIAAILAQIEAETSGPDDGLSDGAIFGIIIGAIVVLCVAGFLVYRFVWIPHAIRVFMEEEGIEPIPIEEPEEE